MIIPVKANTCTCASPPTKSSGDMPGNKAVHGTLFNFSSLSGFSDMITGIIAIAVFGILHLHINDGNLDVFHADSRRFFRRFSRKLFYNSPSAEISTVISGNHYSNQRKSAQ